LQSIAEVKAKAGPIRCPAAPQEPSPECCVEPASTFQEGTMGLGRGALLWLLGIPLPIIILLAIFWS
jgi:hypothetical protein